MTDPTGWEEFSLVRLLYEWQKRQHEEHLPDTLDPSTIYVTDLVYCPLKREFRTRFPDLTFTFKPAQVTGSILHEGLRRLLEEKGFEVEKPVEARVSVGGREVTVKGRIDAVRDDVVIEIKTGRPGQQLPHEHHLLQLKAYLDLTGVGRGLLVYITPDRLVEYPVEREEGVLERLVLEHLARQRAPLWEWECRSCSFADYCPNRV